MWALQRLLALSEKEGRGIRYSFPLPDRKRLEGRKS